MGDATTQDRSDRTAAPNQSHQSYNAANDADRLLLSATGRPVSRVRAGHERSTRPNRRTREGEADRRARGP
jgi:hypothetical protein